MTLTQRKYALDLLHRVNMENCNPTSTPLSAIEPLACDTGTLLGADDSFRYRSVVGGLQYLTLTRPDISFAVNKVCQFLSQPTDVHWEAVKRILQYIKGTLQIGLHIRKSPSTGISIFTDADWAGTTVDPQEVMLCLLDQISSREVQRNNLRFRDLVPRLSIKLWLMAL
jgi:histone deacetylase 1/2